MLKRLMLSWFATAIVGEASRYEVVGLGHDSAARAMGFSDARRGFGESEVARQMRAIDVMWARDGLPRKSGRLFR